MWIIISILIIGFLIGRLIKNRGKKVISPLIMVAIFILLFILGISVGSNEEIISNLSVIGLDAFLITIGGITGSVALAWGIYIYYFQDGKQDNE